MSTNVSIEYVEAQKKYLNAKTREQKILALEEMIRFAPGHKGAENLRAELKSRLAKLKAKTEIKKGGRQTTIAKEGDAQVCIIGFTQSGKSTLLSKLTNAKPEISSHPYTTTKPQIGTLDYGGVKIQLIEIPSTFQSSYMSLAQNSDAIVLIANNEREESDLENILKTFRVRKPRIIVNKNNNLQKVKDNIWNSLGLIRIYTKEPGKKAEKRPLVLKANSTVEDTARNVHKDFVKNFKFARIWGKSVKIQGSVVGLEYRLSDGDVVEIHTKS